MLKHTILFLNTWFVKGELTELKFVDNVVLAFVLGVILRLRSAQGLHLSDTFAYVISIGGCWSIISCMRYVTKSLKLSIC